MTLPPLQIPINLIAGALLGAAYFAALRMNVGLYAAGGRPWLAIATHVSRIAVAAAAFAAFAGQGADALLAALLGFLVARVVATLKTGRA